MEKEKEQEKTKEEKKKEAVAALYKNEEEDKKKKNKTKKKTPKKKKAVKENEEEIEVKPKRFFCFVNVFAIILSVIIFGEVFYYYIFCEYFVKGNSTSKPNNNPESSEVLNDSKYNNYKEASFSPTDENNNDVRMTLKVDNKTLTGTLDEEEITINNIEGNVVSFTYGMAENGYLSLLVITEDNKLFAAQYAMFTGKSNSGNPVHLAKKIDFTLLETEEKVVDITNYECEASYNTLTPTLAVVLENKEIRTLSYEETINGIEYVVDSEDINLVKKYEGMLKVYKDGTIGFSDWYGLNTLMITYNGEKLVVDKVFYREIVEGRSNYFYVISSNYLYKIDMYYPTEDTYSLNGVTLVNANEIAKEKEKIITFEDETIVNLTIYEEYDLEEK